MSKLTVDFHARLNDAYRAAGRYVSALSILAHEYERIGDTQSARVLRGWASVVDNGHKARLGADRDEAERRECPSTDESGEVEP